MNNKNPEGYPDPTATEAIARVTREEKSARAYKPLVYVASPFTGDKEYNTQKAQRYCRFAVAKGCIPLAPHLHYPQFMDDDDPEERKQGLFFALVLLCKCDELWVFGERVSEGMAKEIEKAKKCGIPFRRFNSKCEEVQSV